MAEQINTKFNQPTLPVTTPIQANNNNNQMNGQIHPSIGATHQHSSESVDLDNLFAFLSEVAPNPPSSTNPLLDEIGEKMDNLVQDLDIEVKI